MNRTLTIKNVPTPDCARCGAPTLRMTGGRRGDFLRCVSCRHDLNLAKPAPRPTPDRGPNAD